MSYIVATITDGASRLSMLKFRMPMLKSRMDQSKSSDEVHAKKQLQVDCPFPCKLAFTYKIDFQVDCPIIFVKSRYPNTLLFFDANKILNLPANGNVNESICYKQRLVAIFDEVGGKGCYSCDFLKYMLHRLKRPLSFQLNITNFLIAISITLFHTIGINSHAFCRARSQY